MPLTQATKDALASAVATLKGHVDALQADAGPTLPAISNFIATPAAITVGDSVTLNATVANAVTLTLNGTAVTLPVTLTPADSTTYTLAATNAAGTVNASVVVNVSPAAALGKMPVAGNSHMHMQQNWMCDWIDATLVQGRAVPWTLGFDLANGILAKSLNGVAPKRSQAWHLWGNPTELYSQFPWFDPQGRSHPYSPETSDDIDVMVADFKVRPPKAGARGIGMPISQASIIPHPTMFPAVDGTMAKTPNTGAIPRHPLAIWVRHDAQMQLVYADGRCTNLGAVPGITHVQDACIDGRNLTDPVARKFLYFCDLGNKDATGKWVGGRIAKVDRTFGSEAIGGTPPEDTSKYIVTTIAPAGFPSAVRSAPNGDLYFIDGDKGGEITVVPLGGVPAKLCTVPNAFAMDYANGKLHVMCTTAEVHIVDIATATVGPNLMPASAPLTVPAGRGVDFFTISVDANGTCGPVGAFMCSRVHTNGNTNSWHFSPDGATVLYGNAIYKSAQGWNTCGDVLNVHELFGHYDWLGGKYHVDQAVQFVGGYANVPTGVIVHDPWINSTTPAPAQTSVDYTAIWRGVTNICNGGTMTANPDRPSLTCLMTREGWSPFAGCSNDELAEMGFDAMEAFIHAGYQGSFRRDDIVGVDLYCLMLHHCVNSQRNIREGAAFITSFKTWWTGKGRALPPSPAGVVNTATMGRPFVTTHVDGNVIDYRLEVREMTAGGYRIGIFGSASSDIRYTTQSEYTTNPTVGPVPADAVIVVDKGMPSEQIGTAGLTRGWHAFTVRAAGWNTGAVTYFVP
jgi:hypothetical protein